MANLFGNLFSRIVNAALGARKTQPGLTKHETTSGRTGAPSADQLQEKIKSETKQSIDLLKEKIAAGKADMLAGIEKRGREDLERDRVARDAADQRRRMNEAWYNFIDLGVPLVRGVHFQSSNVEWVQYDKQYSSLYICYRTGHQTDGRTYRYWTVNEALARSAFESASKGRFVWDNLRIRGTLLGHRLNYALVNAGNALPKWARGVNKILEHEEQVAAESGMDEMNKSLGMETMPTTFGGGPQLERPQVFGIGQTSGPQPYQALGKFALSKPKTNTAGPQVTQSMLTDLLRKLQEENG